jgi:hypothetical protein
MAYCPSCDVELAADALRCAHCNATFDAPDAWKPTAAPSAANPRESRGGRIFGILVKVVLGAVSLAFLVFAYAIANRGNSGDAWRALSVGAMLLTVAVAIRARAAWMLLVVLGSFALFFSSCTANFHWGG